MFLRPHSLATLALALLGTGAIAQECKIPSYYTNPCDTQSCIRQPGLQYTDQGGNLLGTDPPSDVTYTSLIVPCFCQYTTRSSYGDLAAAEAVLVTQCGGIDFWPLGGLKYWFDGVAVRDSGYKPSWSSLTGADYDYMKCVSTTPTSLPKSDGQLVYLARAQPEVNVEASLPDNAVANPSGLCVGFTVDQGEDNANQQVASAFQDAQDCSVTKVVTTINAPSYLANVNKYPSFTTVCNSDGSIYWNGAGYRTARVKFSTNDSPTTSQYIDDMIQLGTTTVDSSTLAFVGEAGSAGQGGSESASPSATDASSVLPSGSSSSGTSPSNVVSSSIFVVPTATGSTGTGGGGGGTSASSRMSDLRIGCGSLFALTTAGALTLLFVI